MSGQQQLIVYLTGMVVTLCLFAAVGIKTFYADLSRWAPQENFRPVFTTVTMLVGWPILLLTLAVYMLFTERTRQAR